MTSRMNADSVSLGGGNATGGGNDLMIGGPGDDGPIGDSVALEGTATGAGDDVILVGSGIEFVIGDSEGLEARGNGGDDVIDLGADGGFVAIGDHNINDVIGGRAIGGGNDVIRRTSLAEFLYGDSAVSDASVTSAGNDVITGGGGVRRPLRRQRQLRRRCVRRDCRWQRRAVLRALVPTSLSAGPAQ